MTAFGDKFEAIRKAKKVTLRAMGAQVGMSHSNINKILKGSHEAPRPPLGAELEMWFDAVGTTEEEEPLLRLLAAAAHVPDNQAREQLEGWIISHVDEQKVQPIRRVTIPRRVAEVDAPPVPSTRQDPPG